MKGKCIDIALFSGHQVGNAKRYAEQQREDGYSARIFNRYLRVDRETVPLRVVVVREKENTP